MATDLTYRDDGLFTRFMPESPAGEEAWRKIAEGTDDTGKVLSIHANNVISQLRQAGYSVRRDNAKPTMTDDELLAALEADAQDDELLTALKADAHRETSANAPDYAYNIRKTEKTSWNNAMGFHADISARDSISNPVWGISTIFWSNPTSRASKEGIEARAKEFIEKISKNPPEDILEIKNGNPRIFWMHDGGGYRSEEPIKLAVLFEDDYILSGPHDGPFARNYAALVLPLDETLDDYPRRIGPKGFDDLYVETNLDALDGDLRQRVEEAVKLERPDLAAQFQKAGDGPSP